MSDLVIMILDYAIIVITADTVIVDNIAAIVVVIRMRLCETEETFTWIAIFW